MFRLKYSKTFDNVEFTKCGVKAVQEDYYEVNNNIFCVADGVTRDMTNGSIAKYPKNEEEVQEYLEYYPNPSGAYRAANICATNFIKYLCNCNIKNINETDILEVVKKVNYDICKINKGRNIDYTIEDLYCCVASGGIILNNFLYCFCIGDCRTVLLDEKNNQLFGTDNDVEKYEVFSANYLYKLNYDWNNPKDRMLVRGFFRNNPKLIGNNKLVSYGVLSGEKEAEAYLHVYKVKLDNVKYICAYSDGCEPFFENKEELNKVIENPEYISTKGKERSIIIYERV